jgi:hypothetical protein
MSRNILTDSPPRTSIGRSCSLPDVLELGLGHELGDPFDLFHMLLILLEVEVKVRIMDILVPELPGQLAVIPSGMAGQSVVSLFLASALLTPYRDELTAIARRKRY